jgi:hypothetical protein
MSLWALSSTLVSAGHDLYQRYDAVVAQGANLTANRWMRFIADNGPRSLYDGWQLSLDGLLVQTLGMVDEVGGWPGSSGGSSQDGLLPCMPRMVVPML